MEENQVEQTPKNTAEDESLPFPRARVVSIMRQVIKDRQIRSEVKDAMNLWLGNLLKKIAKEMGNTQYGSIGIADFQRATKPYDMIEDIIKDEKRLLASTEKLQLDADHITREMKHFFTTLKGSKEE